jgi:hypothetical protein
MLPLIATAGFSLMVGCTPPPPKVTVAPAPTPATPEQAQLVQADVAKAIPGSVVGHVSGISGSLAAVSFPAPIPSVKKGESIQFMDSRSMGIANGLVLSVDATNPDYPMVIVDFEPTATGRAPIAGDLAIYVPPTH